MKSHRSLGVGKLLNGYTIVEVLIFLAVSGGLLVSAATLINGRQERVRFSQSIDNMAQQLEDVLNDVSTGFYPTAGNIGCTETAGTLNISSVSKEQGTNAGCVFSGKLLSFTNNSTDYDVYTIVSPASADTFTTGSKQLLGTSGAGNPGVKDSFSNQSGIRVKKILVGQVMNTPLSMVQVDPPGLIVASSYKAGATTRLEGNVARVSLYKYNATPAKNLDNSYIVAVNSNEQVVFCLAQDGETSDSKSAYITINSQMSVERIIGSKGPGC